jgi:hypothetical protein
MKDILLASLAICAPMVFVALVAFVAECTNHILEKLK